MRAEEWKPVVGFEDWYDVSSHGAVRTWHNNRWGRAKSPRLVSQATHADGRKAVFLTHPDAEKGTNFKVHVLVMAAFVGPRPEGHEICHNDGNPANNVVSNLRYDTHQANSDDTVAHGRSPKGTRNGMNVLEADAVFAILEMMDTGRFTQREVAERFNVARTAVNNIVHGYTWGWLTGRSPRPRVSRSLHMGKVESQP